ncbi:AB hydrolase superfamily protein C4A8.06c [Psilocybe cubensis]|uniref:AB hydrolase superfamily protein C4A8.06c n=1 Tax=Psilocybe cubensis TaxID=181762 RepID=A0ACB8H420_PSICU|nr:AB hydrolase superfamily protein C4A8.06c [Psilocybe cubensis]KAH9482748.1 AB hydrolase superfamily protein C4A8.06c [Psilocybe cubensis]
MIPLSSCNDAADALIDWFGPEDLKYVVGGERWWQVRGLNGVDAEWIAEQEDVSNTPPKSENGKKRSTIEADIARMEELDTVMLYVHGAQKFKGKAFAVNYRKAPQYPWPCALQDVLAAYFYLINPPHSAAHKPIPPSKIVFAGDSAGGGLCLTTLTILRDLNMPMPAGAVLISPWIDLTHSFPSVMQNYETDIIPKHGFLAKPSTLWPLPTRPEHGGRVVTTVTNVPPRPGDADTLKPLDGLAQRGQVTDSNIYGPGKPVQTQEQMLTDSQSPSFLNNREKAAQHLTSGHIDVNSIDVDPAQGVTSSIEKDISEDDIENWHPKPPKVLMENPNAVPLELRSQIQMYATTEQLTHPLVSPVLQGSLGNLPPLYIIAGEGELLRDEIIYLAHKAAHPKDYPASPSALKSRRQRENSEKYIEPTKAVNQAKYAYRAVAEFIKHVTKYDEEHLKRNPFPELHRPPEDIPVDRDPDLQENAAGNTDEDKCEEEENSANVLDVNKQKTPSDIGIYLENQALVVQETGEPEADTISSKTSKTTQCNDDNQDIPGLLMIRERVDIYGKVRPMEPRDKLAALQLAASEIGLLKEAPALRWAAGQDEWDRVYSKQAERVLKQKSRHEEKARHMLQRALQQGFVHSSHGQPNSEAGVVMEQEKKVRRRTSVGKIQPDRRWGPLDLEGERPPPSAIAGRVDTPEALALLKKHIYFTAPVTHLMVPKVRARDAIQAAFDPDDDPNKPPPQSVSEEQIRARCIPVHGLRMWDNILRWAGL